MADIREGDHAFPDWGRRSASEEIDDFKFKVSIDGFLKLVGLYLPPMERFEGSERFKITKLFRNWDQSKTPSSFIKDCQALPYAEVFKLAVRDAVDAQLLWCIRLFYPYVSPTHPHEKEKTKRYLPEILQLLSEVADPTIKEFLGGLPLSEDLTKLIEERRNYQQRVRRYKVPSVDPDLLQAVGREGIIALVRKSATESLVSLSDDPQFIEGLKTRFPNFSDLLAIE